MKYILSACAVVLVVLCSASFAGCDDSGSGGTYIALTAQTTVNGVTQNLSNATFVGNAQPGSYSCDPASDSNCVPNFDISAPNGTTDVATDALPATWVIAVQPTTDCTAGGSTGALELGTDAPVTVVCGVNDGGLVTASPNSCDREFDEATNTYLVNTCPSGFSVTLTTSGATFPTDHAMVASVYSSEGSQIVSNWNITASSSTSITVTPSSLINGQNVITITDPNTNQVIGAALYTYSLILYSGSGPR